jgi:hypothetical protein
VACTSFVASDSRRIRRLKLFAGIAKPASSDIGESGAIVDGLSK